jgi:hypothetical protein
LFPRTWRTFLAKCKNENAKEMMGASKERPGRKTGLQKNSCRQTEGQNNTN